MCIFVHVCMAEYGWCVGWGGVRVCVWVAWAACVQPQRSVKEESIIISCTVPAGQSSRWSMADMEENRSEDERRQVTFGGLTGYFRSHFHACLRLCK